MGFKSGKAGKATIGGSTAKITRWRLNYFTKLKEITGWDCAGHGVFYKSGILYGDIEIDFNWDFTVFPFGSISCAPGGTATVVLYGDRDSGTTFFTGTCVYETIDITSEIRGLVKGTLRGKYTGSFSKPTT